MFNSSESFAFFFLFRRLVYFQNKTKKNLVQTFCKFLFSSRSNPIREFRLMLLEIATAWQVSRLRPSLMGIHRPSARGHKLRSKKLTLKENTEPTAIQGSFLITRLNYRTVGWVETSPSLGQGQTWPHNGNRT